MIPASLAPLLLDQATIDDVTNTMVALDFWIRYQPRAKKGHGEVTEPPRPKTDDGNVLLDAIHKYAPGVRLDTETDAHTLISEEWATFDMDRRYDKFSTASPNYRKYSRLYMILRDHLPPIPREDAHRIVLMAQDAFVEAFEARKRLAEDIRIQTQIEDDNWHREQSRRERAARARFSGDTSG